MPSRRPIPLHLPATLALALTAAACADAERPTDETAPPPPPVGFHCVANIDEVADDPLDPETAPACRIGELAAVTVGGRPVPAVTLVERGPLCHHTPQGYVVDLAPSVASRLYDRYASEPTFTPLGDSPTCPDTTTRSTPVNLTGGEAARLEVTTVATVPATGPSGQRWVFSAAVDGRLVDTRTGRVLWQDTCRTDTAELQAAATFPDIGNLRRVLAGEAERCVAGFAAALGAPVPL